MFVRPYAPANEAVGAALVGARDALRRTPFSREALRTEVVRYGAVSRDAEASMSDLADALDIELAPALNRFPCRACRRVTGACGVVGGARLPSRRLTGRRGCRPA